MKTTKWRGYSELAWTEPIIASPEEYVEETEQFSKVIKENSKVDPKTLLHLSCGAGGNEYTFKKHFKVTGVDISEGMLEIARNCNPEVLYLYGDMRTIKLGKCFDAIAIPDSIGYMTTVDDLRSAIINYCTQPPKTRWRAFNCSQYRGKIHTEQFCLYWLQRRYRNHNF